MLGATTKEECTKTRQPTEDSGAGATSAKADDNQCGNQGRQPWKLTWRRAGRRQPRVRHNRSDPGDRARRNQQPPALPNHRVPHQRCPAPYSTVYVKGLRNTVSEPTYVEWLDSIGGVFNPRCNAMSSTSVGSHDRHELNNREVHSFGRWL